RAERADRGRDVWLGHAALPQLGGQSSPGQAAAVVPGLDPGLRERGVVDQPDLGEPAEHRLGHVIGYPPLAQSGSKLRVRPRRRRQHPQADLPRRRLLALGAPGVQLVIRCWLPVRSGPAVRSRAAPPPARTSAHSRPAARLRILRWSSPAARRGAIPPARAPARDRSATQVRPAAPAWLADRVRPACLRCHASPATRRQTAVCRWAACSRPALSIPALSVRLAIQAGPVTWR